MLSSNAVQNSKVVVTQHASYSTIDRYLRISITNPIIIFFDAVVPDVYRQPSAF